MENTEVRQQVPHSEIYLTDDRSYWWDDDYLALLANRLQLRDCSVLADIGCGRGDLSFALAPYLAEGAQIIGIDTEQRWLEEAAARRGKYTVSNNTSIRFQSGDARNIPFPDETTDITLCQTLLIHMDDPLHVVSEMGRITRKNGWVVAIEPNNSVRSLISDSISGQESLAEKLTVIECRLLIEEGRKQAGKGDDSLGDQLPRLFLQAGLRDIRVWIADKALSLIPPYHSVEMRVRERQMLETPDEQLKEYCREEEEYFFLAGGSREKYAQYMSILSRRGQKIVEAVQAGEYVFGGGSLMYIVAGRK